MVKYYTLKLMNFNIMFEAKEIPKRLIHNDIAYNYNSFYKRYESQTGASPYIICPKCYNDIFRLSYKNSAIISVCTCGHELIINNG